MSEHPVRSKDENYRQTYKKIRRSPVHVRPRAPLSVVPTEQRRPSLTLEQFPAEPPTQPALSGSQRLMESAAFPDFVALVRRCLQEGRDSGELAEQMFGSLAKFTATNALQYELSRRVLSQPLTWTRQKKTAESLVREIFDAESIVALFSIKSPRRLMASSGHLLSSQSDFLSNLFVNGLFVLSILGRKNIRPDFIFRLSPDELKICLKRLIYLSQDYPNLAQNVIFMYPEFQPETDKFRDDLVTLWSHLISGNERRKRPGSIRPSQATRVTLIDLSLWEPHQALAQLGLSLLHSQETLACLLLVVLIKHPPPYLFVSEDVIDGLFQLANACPAVLVHYLGQIQVGQSILPLALVSRITAREQSHASLLKRTCTNFIDAVKLSKSVGISGVVECSSSGSSGSSSGSSSSGSGSGSSDEIESRQRLWTSLKADIQSGLRTERAEETWLEVLRGLVSVSEPYSDFSDFIEVLKAILPKSMDVLLSVVAGSSAVALDESLAEAVVQTYLKTRSDGRFWSSTDVSSLWEVILSSLEVLKDQTVFSVIQIFTRSDQVDDQKGVWEICRRLGVRAAQNPEGSLALLHNKIFSFISKKYLRSYTHTYTNYNNHGHSHGHGQPRGLLQCYEWLTLAEFPELVDERLVTEQLARVEGEAGKGGPDAAMYRVVLRGAPLGGIKIHEDMLWRIFEEYEPVFENLGVQWELLRSMDDLWLTSFFCMTGGHAHQGVFGGYVVVAMRLMGLDKRKTWRTGWVLKTMKKYLEWVGGLGVLGVTRHLSGLEAVGETVSQVPIGADGKTDGTMEELIGELAQTSRDLHLPCEGRLWLECLRRGIQVTSLPKGIVANLGVYAFEVTVEEVCQALEGRRVGEEVVQWALEKGYFGDKSSAEFARRILINYLTSFNYFYSCVFIHIEGPTL